MIFNVDSINIDHVFSVARLPQAGETLRAEAYQVFLGGKGLNQSIALAKALSGSQVEVCHIGAVGNDGGWVLDQISAFGLSVAHIQRLEDCASGLASIYVDQAAENVIVLHGGANQALTLGHIKSALEPHKGKRAWVLFQNETNLTVQSAKLARELGYRIAYTSAPFISELTLEMLPLVDLITVNETEAKQLQDSLGHPLEKFKDLRILLTKGAQGALFMHQGKAIAQQAFRVKAVDTTGAGDTFFGSFMACYAQSLAQQGASEEQLILKALRYAAGAAALQVTKKGAAIAIPEHREVIEFLRDKP